MSNPDGVLEAIDACLDDYELSDDAMRWVPDEPDPTPEDAPCPYWTGPIFEQLERDMRNLFGAALPPWQRAYLNIAAEESFVTTGEYALTTERAATALAEFASELQSTARTALDAFGKAFAPVFGGIQSSLHKSAYKGVRGHKRRCRICNPAGFPNGMSIDRSQYRRRSRGRR